MFSDRMNVWDAEPRNDLLASRQDDTSWLLAGEDGTYALYFGRQATVELTVQQQGSYTLQWLDIENSSWLPAEEFQVDGKRLMVEAPEGVHWLALISRQ